MFFRFCLWLLAKRIDGLMQEDEGFQAAIKKKACVIQFKTTDNKVARYFDFAWGEVKTEEAVHANPTLTFSIPSATIARKLIMMMAKDPSDKSRMIEAIKYGDLRFSGDIALLTWFMVISEYFAPESITIPLINKTIHIG